MLDNNYKHLEIKKIHTEHQNGSWFLWILVLQNCEIAKGILKKPYKKYGNRLLNSLCSSRTKDNGFKPEEGRLRLDVRKSFFDNEGGKNTGTGCPEWW